MFKRGTLVFCLRPVIGGQLSILPGIMHVSFTSEFCMVLHEGESPRLTHTSDVFLSREDALNYARTLTMVIQPHMVHSYLQSLLLEPRREESCLDSYFDVMDFTVESWEKARIHLESTVPLIPKDMLDEILESNKRFAYWEDSILPIEEQCFDNLCHDIGHVMYEEDLRWWPNEPAFIAFIKLAKANFVRYKAEPDGKGKVVLMEKIRP